jgi:hypothetical protein
VSDFTCIVIFLLETCITYSCAGAKINKIYHETFAYDISQLDPLYELEDDDILTAIRNGTVRASYRRIIYKIVAFIYII